MEIEIDEAFLKSPVALEVQGHLEAWLGSRCPEHLGPILELSKD